MKKLTIITLCLLISGLGFAQSEKYMQAMLQKVPAIDTTHSIGGLVDLANSFERIGDAEKTQCLPYYYASLAHTEAGLMMNGGAMGGNAEKTDPEAERATSLLSKAEALTKENAEIWILKKMISTLRMMGDPMNRYMNEMGLAQDAMDHAKKLSPDNPRIYLLEGQDKFYTPEQYGGSKEEAKKLFIQAQEKFNTFKPETEIHPSWGRAQLAYMLSQLK
jgi:hypothetical protein